MLSFFRILCYNGKMVYIIIVGMKVWIQKKKELKKV